MQINNLARDNLHDKLGILSELVTDEFWPWFANYMVVKRAAQVSNAATPHTRMCMLCNVSAYMAWNLLCIISRVCSS